MRQIIVILLSIGLANIAFGHTLDSEHSLVESLWHQLVGIHHLPYTMGLIVGGIVMLAVIGRRIVRYRTR